MSLRTKLLLVALVTLSLPWAAWRFVLATEGFLRQGQEQTLLATARSMARVVAEQAPEQLRSGASQGLYVHKLSGAIAMDGYLDDWGPWAEHAQSLGQQASLEASVLAVQSQSQLFLLIQVVDSELLYASADGHRPGDQIELTLAGRRGFRSLRLATSTPGRVTALRAEDGAVDSAIRAEWQESPQGYQIEIQAPLSLADQGVAIQVIDRDSAGVTRASVATSASPEIPAEAAKPPQVAEIWPLLESRPGLQRLLGRLGPESGRVWLLNAQGWVLARSGMLETDQIEDEYEPGSMGRWWRTLVYRQLLAPPLEADPPPGAEAPRHVGQEVVQARLGEAMAVWRPAESGLSVVASAAVPIIANHSSQTGSELGSELGFESQDSASDPVLGVVVVEQASDALLLLTNQALARLVMFTVVAMLSSTIVLLFFATRLSGRIRRLRDAVDQAMTQDGEIRSGFAASKNRDELGDLSRSFADLLAELRGYNEYLRSLASRLSHELNTPLAVVRSSLENLESVTSLSGDGESYLDRARHGTERLQGILRAMGEARRLEESLTRAELETFDLNQLVGQCCEGYRAVGQAQIEAGLAGIALPLKGSPELIAQMLDKLVDNAVSFTPPDGAIRVSLSSLSGHYQIEVSNDGPTLPENLKGRLFDSMVSLRQDAGERMHLGLGLHIVRLIAQFHGGSVSARDREDNSGVVFQVTLPR